MLHSGEPPAPAPNGIPFPQGYETWRVIALSHRTDHPSLRVILGNDTAVRAAEAGDTHHAEFMVKDAGKYPATGGWGYARWLGEEYTPYGDNPDFVQECAGCHAPMKKNDYVFTRPATFPKFTTGS